MWSAWQKFEFGKFFDRIPRKLSNEVLAVYHDYEGDHKDAFSYFIGCKVKDDTKVPEGLRLLVVPGGAYKKIMAKGVIPDCISNTWKGIWEADLARDFRPDFEVYDDRSRDWNNAEVDIYVSVKRKS